MVFFFMSSDVHSMVASPYFFFSFTSSLVMDLGSPGSIRSGFGFAGMVVGTVDVVLAGNPGIPSLPWPLGRPLVPLAGRLF